MRIGGWFWYTKVMPHPYMFNRAEFRRSLSVKLVAQKLRICGMRRCPEITGFIDARDQLHIESKYHVETIQL